MGNCATIPANSLVNEGIGVIRSESFGYCQKKCWDLHWKLTVTIYQSYWF